MEITDLTTIYAIALIIITIVIIIKLMKNIVEIGLGVVVLAFLFNGNFSIPNIDESFPASEQNIVSLNQTNESLEGKKLEEDQAMDFSESREKIPSDIPRIAHREQNNNNINCLGKVIEDGNYVIVEGVYSDEMNAQRSVNFWKNNGFFRADFFTTTCYDTEIPDQYFAVILGDPVEDEIDAKLKKKKATQRYMDMNIDIEPPSIIQIKKRLFQNKKIK